MLAKVLAEDLLEKGGLEMVELRLSSWRWGRKGKNNMSSVINKYNHSKYHVKTSLGSN